MAHAIQRPPHDRMCPAQVAERLAGIIMGAGDLGRQPQAASDRIKVRDAFQAMRPVCRQTQFPHAIRALGNRSWIRGIRSDGTKDKMQQLHRTQVMALHARLGSFADKAFIGIQADLAEPVMGAGSALKATEGFFHFIKEVVIE